MSVLVAEGAEYIKIEDNIVVGWEAEHRYTRPHTARPMARRLSSCFGGPRFVAVGLTTVVILPAAALVVSPAVATNTLQLTGAIRNATRFRRTHSHTAPTRTL